VFQGQIDAGRLSVLHKSGAALRITENHKFGWTQPEPDRGCTSRVIDASENGELSFVERR
jgi:hypothetical protein